MACSGPLVSFYGIVFRTTVHSGWAAVPLVTATSHYHVFTWWCCRQSAHTFLDCNDGRGCRHWTPWPHTTSFVLSPCHGTQSKTQGNRSKGAFKDENSATWKVYHAIVKGRGYTARALRFPHQSKRVLVI